MKNTQPPSRVFSARESLLARDLSRLIDSYLLVGDIAQHSARTRESRKERLDKLLWFARAFSLEALGKDELRAFFHYLTQGHLRPGGRWGNPLQKEPLRPGTIKSYFNTLRTFFNWLIEEGELDTSPMDRIPPIIDRADQPQPFTKEDVTRLLLACKRMRYSERDSALVLLMLDTGLRASEVCSIRLGDIAANVGADGEIVVEGKGRKRRLVPFSTVTRRALKLYLGATRRRFSGDEMEETAMPDQPFFLAHNGPNTGGALSRHGLLQVCHRLGVEAGIEECHPHRFRHTFAIEFLRAGGNVFTLKTILGHESLTMTNRYVAIAQADVARQHRLHSPVMALRKR